MMGMSDLRRDARRLAFAALLLVPSMVCMAQGLPIRDQQAYNPYLDRANKPQPTPLAQRLVIEVVNNRPVLGLDVPDMSAANGMIGGMTLGIGGVISGMASSASHDPGSPSSRDLARLQEHLGDYDFNAVIEAAIRSRIASPGLSPEPVFVPPSGPPDGQAQMAFAPRALVVYPSYVVDYRFDRLKVVLFVRIVDRRLNGKGRLKTTVSFTRTYGSAFLVRDGSQQENLSRWLAMPPTRLRALLDRSAEEAVDLLVHDFSDAGRREWKRSAQKKSARMRGVVFHGLPIRQDDDRVWVRSGTRLQWLDAYSFADEPVAP
jgi:hypothetical protein